MYVIIEEYKYPAEKVEKVLRGLNMLENLEHEVSVSYVGYFYNPEVNDCVFILPKVLVNEQNLVFNRLNPVDIIDLDKAADLKQEERDFIYEFAVWIYRAINVFNKDEKHHDIVFHKRIPMMGHGRRYMSNTFLDILLSLIQFNRENQDFLMFTLRNIHSGFNKINWTRTIAKSPAIIQDNSPVYLNPVNKKKQINFDEELLIIFFSILNYVHEHYGFPVSINCNFQLLTSGIFEHYMKGFGKTRLRQIKYKYFSDKALRIWELCYAFFDRAHEIAVSKELQEYLLVKNFNIVFEAIIDELVGDKDIPDGLADQEDGKRVDHMYRYRDLTNNTDNKPIYYIGDSKYYKLGHQPGRESVYKQFTYARNVIQWNLDLFMNDEAPKGDHVKLRDDVTEGYNIIPNFFISARMDDQLRYVDDIQPTKNKDATFDSRQFENRLFDRDTLLVCHYDVNFLYVVALYARENGLEKKAWQKKVREMFRTQVQKMLNEKYQFYAMTPHEDVRAVTYLEDHFQQLLGKVFTPYPDQEGRKYFSLALDKDERYAEENDTIVNQLGQAFYIKKCNIGDNPKEVLPDVGPMVPYSFATPQFLTLHYLERYTDKNILVGAYHTDKPQLDWILGKNDKGTLIYNVRLDKSRPGGQKVTELRNKVVSFVVLYEDGHPEKGYRVFHVHHHAVMDEERMREAWYPAPHGKYFCYVFDEEVTLGNLDIVQLLSDECLNADYIPGQPVFKTGEEMLGYRK